MCTKRQNKPCRYGRSTDHIRTTFIACNICTLVKRLRLIMTFFQLLHHIKMTMLSCNVQRPLPSFRLQKPCRTWCGVKTYKCIRDNIITTHNCNNSTRQNEGLVRAPGALETVHGKYISTQATSGVHGNY